MTTKLHNTITGEQAIHQAAYVQDSDPGAVGAYRLWWDTTDGVLKMRNAADTDWLELATAPTGVITDPSADQAIVSQSAAIVPLIVRAHPTQSASAFAVEDSAGNDLFAIAPGGNLLMASAAPTIVQAKYANDATSVLHTLRKSRSASVGGQTIVQNGDVLAQWVASGSDGVGFIVAGAMRIDVDGTPGVNDMPGRILFSTTADGAAAVTERMRIDSKGMVEMKAGVKFTGIISPTQLVANQDNWNPTSLDACATIRVSTDAARDLTGIVAQASGVRIRLRNVGAFTLTLKHNVTSTAANRFYCPAAADYELTQKSSAWVTYDTTDSRWYVG